MKQNTEQFNIAFKLCDDRQYPRAVCRLCFFEYFLAYSSAQAGRLKVPIYSWRAVLVSNGNYLETEIGTYTSLIKLKETFKTVYQLHNNVHMYALYVM